MDSSDGPSEFEGRDHDDASGAEGPEAGVGSDPGGAGPGWSLSTVFGSRATTAVGLVVAVTVLGLALRLVLLGDRIAHWDEGRVGYWILYYQETGSFAYRRIIHGPFVQHANRWLFELLAANDFTMRLPVALISATLPLSALFFRKHLRKAELVAMALFLAANPVLLYYSRFMRSDLLVATFMFLALGTLVRFYDTRKWRYVYAAAALMACGFASKENAILYVLTWLGALGLLADQALYRPRDYRSGYHLLSAKLGDYFETARSALGSTASADDGEERADGGATDGESSADRDQRRSLWPFARAPLHVVGAAMVFLAFSLFFYAPRGAGELGLRYPPQTTEQVMFWQAVADPTLLPTLIEGTWNYVSTEYGQWFSQAGESGDRSLVSVYAEYLGRYVKTMGLKAAPMTILAVGGFLYERYVRAESRNLVMFSAYCGFVSVLGYPLGTDIFGAWIVVHALVPLAIPAAVGLALPVSWGRAAFVADDGIGVAAAAVVLLLVGGQVAGVAAASVYQNPQSDDNYLVQYAQPSDDPRAEFQAMRRLGEENRTGPDVMLYYGEPENRYSEGDALVEQNPAEWNNSYYNYRPHCSKWFNILPLPWYFAASDTDVDCARQAGTLVDQIDRNPPPIVITVREDRQVPRDRLTDEYTRAAYSMRTSGTYMVFWVHESVDIDRETEPVEDPRTPIGPQGRSSLGQQP